VSQSLNNKMGDSSGKNRLSKGSALSPGTPNN